MGVDLGTALRQSRSPALLRRSSCRPIVLGFDQKWRHGRWLTRVIHCDERRKTCDRGPLLTRERVLAEHPDCDFHRGAESRGHLCTKTDHLSDEDRALEEHLVHEGRDARAAGVSLRTYRCTEVDPGHDSAPENGAVHVGMLRQDVFGHLRHRGGPSFGEEARLHVAGGFQVGWGVPSHAVNASRKGVDASRMATSRQRSCFEGSSATCLLRTAPSREMTTSTTSPGA